MNKLILTALATITFSTAAQASFQVIANSEFGKTSISKSDLTNIFTGLTTSWGGKNVKVCVMESSTGTAKAFLGAIGSEPGKFDQDWIKRELSGQGTAPESKSTTDAMVSCVKQSGGIGYIPAADAGKAEGVSKLSVN
ncbi:MAG: hypothetical protein CL675_03480 [Bdellovibrionaceae bacterium]|nr:hypothetical protein [Pseudobdellovibrionaceae bacterium]